MSISQKILYSFIIVITLLVISLVSVFVFHSSSLQEYKQISENLILENTLAVSVSRYIESYNAAIIAPGSPERIASYAKDRDAILAIFAELDHRIQNPDSKVAYQGLKKIIITVIESSDSGLQEVINGNVTSGLNTYNEALRRRSFVSENATSLILTEINHLNEIQESIERKYNQQLLVIVTWVISIILTTTLYSLLFARRITQPIKILSRATRKVSAGDYSFRISQDLLKRPDEVGLLAGSFNTMLGNLNEKITQVELAHETILETKKDLEHRNSELERFNQMIIGRELKMIELKKVIESQEAKIHELESKK